MSNSYLYIARRSSWHMLSWDFPCSPHTHDVSFLYIILCTQKSCTATDAGDGMARQWAVVRVRVSDTVNRVGALWIGCLEFVKNTCTWCANILCFFGHVCCRLYLRRILLVWVGESVWLILCQFALSPIQLWLRAVIMVGLTDFTSRRGFVQPAFRQLTAVFFSRVVGTPQSVSHNIRRRQQSAVETFGE